MKGNRSPRGYRLFVLLAAAFIVSTLVPVPFTGQTNSQVRIVRLSFVEGTVTMYRPDADEWAKAFVNTPIQQGFKLATDDNSFAEVEFENGSTARLGQASEIDFTNLSLSPDGGKVNDLTLARGYATFTVAPEQGDVYQVHAAGSTYSAAVRTMFRVDLEQDAQRVEVFKGDIQVQSPEGSGSVAKDQVLQLVPGSANPFQISNGITEDAWDRWVSKRQQAQTVASNNAGPRSTNRSAGGSLYGWNDLSYFGSWNYLAGYGNCWSPMMGAGWAPYSIGSWSWYPGMGYTWISGLPWGWLPFHYGSWIYPAGVGWCWLPGNFSYWSPALVTWYQGPGWVGWTPRAYTGAAGPSVACRSGENCSTAISVNTFQSGRFISPHDVLRVGPIRGRAISSPTVPLTRNLRLPGPAVSGPSFTATTGAAGASGARLRRIGAAPSRIFARGTIRGVWDVQPHAPAVYNPQTRRFVNRSGPAFQSLRRNEANRARRLHGAVSTSTSSGVAGGRPEVNNDVLLRGRTALGRSGLHSGSHRGGLTPIPISSLSTHAGAMHRSSFLVPSVSSASRMSGMRSSHVPPIPDFHQNRFPTRNQRMENTRARRQMERMQRMENARARKEMRRMQRMENARMRRQMETNRNSGISQQGVQRAPESRPSSPMGGGMRNGGGMGGGMRMGSPRGGMSGGGMRGGGGGGSHGPHH